jgi:hypothetical protein
MTPKLFTNFLLTTPAIFIYLPIILSIITNLTMSIVIFVFSAMIFSNRGWPQSNFCRRYTPWDPNDPYRRQRPLPELSSCTEARTTVRICMGIAGGLSIVIG